MWEQDRINATISYFFLGPIFLLAKRGTPLAEPYVRAHAKRASIIVGLTILVGIVYLFARSYIQYAPLGLSLQTIVLTLIMWACSILLLAWAYRAYHGAEVWEGEGISIHENISTIGGGISWVYAVEREEDKIRILASMIPWLGIYLSAKYPDPLMARSRIIGSCFMLIYIVSILTLGSGGFIPFLIVAIYILIFVVEWVYLFIYGRWVSWDILDRIPSCHTLEAHFIASLRSIRDFSGVIFGSEKSGTYQTYLREAQKPLSPLENIPAYFMPRALIAIPVWNIFTIPSLFIERYRAYRPLIIQGLIITILSLLIVFFGGSLRSGLLLLMLFPIVHIFTYAGSDIMTRAPIVGIWSRIASLYSDISAQVATLGSHWDTVGFTYDTTESPGNK